MKKFQHLLMLALFSFVTLNIYGQASDLFFSEYAEGSSFNKYVEISNVTGATVDLSMYQIKKGTNGADFTESMTLTGILADGAVWVVSRSDADPIIVALADELNGNVINFNGDDVMGLFKNEVLIDIIGEVGPDPGDGWEVAGTADGTKDHTLVRKANVCDPITNWAIAAGTNADDSQWIVYEKNFWDELGQHTSDCSGSTQVATPAFSPPGGQYFDAIDVEITCSTPESEIFYTLDGSDPDENSTAYSGAINISTTTTLKARAYVWSGGLEPSAIAQAEYTFAQSIVVADLTELRDSFTGGTETFVVTGEVILTYKQDFRGQKYIQDAAAGILIDDNAGAITTQYALGDGISGMAGTLSEFGNMLQFIPANDPGAPTSSGNQVNPVEITVGEMVSAFEDYEARLVKIQDVSFADQGGTFANGTVYQINDGSKAEGSFRTTFYDMDYIGTMIPSGAGAIVGILNSRAEGDFITARSQADLMWGTVGEPSNYPTGFSAVASGTSISVAWTDATGDILPTGYLVLASDQDNIALPVDGTPIFDDLNFSDGMGALNVIAGVESASFTGLTPEMTYYFKIFSFTNTGAAIDFKTDGTPPVAQATTELVNEVNILFTTFNESWENWTSYSVTGDQVWIIDDIHGIEGTPCAKMSGFVNPTSFANEDWLISPTLNLINYANEKFSFFSAMAYTGDALQVKVSADYDGTGNPNDFTWEDFTAQAQWPPSGSFFEYTSSGMLALSAFTDQSINIAFVYTSTDVESATWELDNIRVVGEGDVVVTPEPTEYPTAFAMTAQDQNITITWMDAAGAVVPQGYLIKISNADNFTAPADGTPIADDLDMSDGMGAKNVLPGVQQFSFNDLEANTTYYAVIYPYTNSGADINYKTDGTAPRAEATTAAAITDLLFTTFNQSWENWTPFSESGDQMWNRENAFGIDSTACARMSGYAVGVSNPNEDWLVSPAIDLTNIANAALMFYSAVAYIGDPLQVLVSANYDGSGNPVDFTWDDFTAEAQWPVEEPFWVWTPSGSISLQDYANQTIWVAFRYTSNAHDSKTWEVDNIRIQGSSSISDPESYLLGLYPNPTSGLINWDLKEAPTAIDVFSVTGQLVYSATLPATSGSINLQRMQKGLYLVRFVLDEQGTAVVRRIIIE
jgi:hypothetical protein